MWGFKEGLLWIILMKKYKENEAVMIEANIRGIINEFLHDSILEIMKISLIVLIVGGAEILIIIKMNHQNLILGEMERIPLNKIVFRE